MTYLNRAKPLAADEYVSECLPIHGAGHRDKVNVDTGALEADAATASIAVAGRIAGVLTT